MKKNNTITSLVKEARNDNRLVNLLCDLSNAAHKAAHCLTRASLLAAGEYWINGRPVAPGSDNAEELFDKALQKARKACRIANVLRKDYGLAYDRFYDLKQDAENFRLAAVLLMELGTATGDASAFDKAEDLLDAADEAVA